MCNTVTWISIMLRARINAHLSVSHAVENQSKAQMLRQREVVVWSEVV